MPELLDITSLAPGMTIEELLAGAGAIGTSVLAGASALGGAIAPALPLLAIPGALAYAEYLVKTGQVKSIVEPAISQAQINLLNSPGYAFAQIRAPDVVIPDVAAGPQVIYPEQTGVNLPVPAKPIDITQVTQGGGGPPPPSQPNRPNIGISIGTSAVAGMGVYDLLQNLAPGGNAPAVQPAATTSTNVGIGAGVSQVPDITPGGGAAPVITPVQAPSQAPAPAAPAFGGGAGGNLGDIANLLNTNPQNTANPSQNVNVHINIHSHNRRLRI